MLGLRELRGFDKCLLALTLLSTAAVPAAFEGEQLVERIVRAPFPAPRAVRTSAPHRAPDLEPLPEPVRPLRVGAPQPEQWKPPRRRCDRYDGRRFCDGPRRVPQPHGEAAQRADDLALGKMTTANELLVGRPRDEWTEAASGRARDDLLWPVERGRLARGFGYVRSTHRNVRHDGIDIRAVPGAHVRAANDGLVAYADNGVRGYGNVVLIVHPDGASSMYAHLRKAYVFAGQRVRRGEVIGAVGSTGLARGPHLHFEWHRQGRPRDPSPRFVDEPHDDPST